ncbi:MAG: hypothetical protein QF819_09210 [Gemmatimonadota bacterium]|jgi:hypothetical protein|nr:hypothetical protein [Gemmatimonadota bacterium]MDP6803328.1 hypothetical protein [Gemmatimonadota bacterium]MDP7031490.1 hypothetical protein [Gemmatimonadota bacterium]
MPRFPRAATARTALFTAWTAGLGFALSGVPNVELMGLSAFVSGLLLGPGFGALSSGLAMSLYSGLNPYGPPLPPVFVAQVAGMAVFGAAGGGIGVFVVRAGGWFGACIAGGAGFLLTLIYDVLTNLGVAASMGTLSRPGAVLAGGLLFSVGHLVSNTVIFAVAGPSVFSALHARFGSGA